VPRLLACLTLALALAPGRATAQWASIGNMPRPITAGSTVTFKNAQGVVAVTAVAPDIIRVRFAPGTALGRDHSYAVVGRDLGAANAKIQVGSDTTTLTTSRLVVTMTHRPFRVSVADTSGAVIERGLPVVQQPTTGVLVGTRFYYIANSQYGRLDDRSGRLAPQTRPPTRTAVRVIDLRP